MLIDPKELPEGPPSPGIDPRNPLVMGTTPWETCVNTLRHHLVPETVKDAYGIEQVRAPFRDLGGVAPARWSVPALPPIEASERDIASAMGFWLREEACSDETLSLTALGTLAASEQLRHQFGIISVTPSVFGARRHHYASPASFWSALRGPKANIAAATCTAVVDPDTLAAVFQMPYVEQLGVAAVIERRKVQGCVRIEPIRVSDFFGEHRKIARDPEQAMLLWLDRATGKPTPDWLTTGKVSEASPMPWTADELTELVVILLPLANRFDPCLARDMAQLLAVYPAWCEGTDTTIPDTTRKLYARTVELTWAWIIQQRVAALMTEVRAKKALLLWAVRSARRRLSLLVPGDKKRVTLVLPYRVCSEKRSQTA